MMKRCVKLLWLVALCALLGVLGNAADEEKPTRKRVQEKRVLVGEWGQDDADVAGIDVSVLPDYWDENSVYGVDPRVQTNAGEPPEQLVKVTDRRHKFPVFATICSISVLVTVITLLVVCTA